MLLSYVNRLLLYFVAALPVGLSEVARGERGEVVGEMNGEESRRRCNHCDPFYHYIGNQWGRHFIMRKC